MSTAPAPAPIDVLLVEDSPTDAELTVRAFKRAKIRNHVHVLRDGAAALSFLRRAAPYTDAPRPDLILLDLMLPRTDGHEVLAQIKQDEQLRTIPVIVLTASRAEDDVVRSYRLEANACVAKPLDPTEFLGVVSSIGLFWLEIVRLP